MRARSRPSLCGTRVGTSTRYCSPPSRKRSRRRTRLLD
nr:MAG TPA: hypothetical protein [Caudoviricetes sp.]